MERLIIKLPIVPGELYFRFMEQHMKRMENLVVIKIGENDGY